MTRGFYACPLRDLISAAGCSTTAFYARFPDKEHVLSELVDALATELFEAAAARLGGATTLADGIDGAAEVVASVLVPRRGLVRVALTEGLTVPAARSRIRAAHEALAAQVAVWLGGPEHPRAEHRAWAVVGALSLQLTRWAVFEDVADAELGAVVRDIAGAALRVRQ